MKAKLLFISMIALTALMGAERASAEWASIAVSDSGHWGYAHNYASKAKARVDALKGCGQSSCQTKFIADTRCIAYAHSQANGYWYGLAYGGSHNSVKKTALSGCRQSAPAGTCQLVLDAC